MNMDWIRLAEVRIQFDILQIRQRNLGFRVLLKSWKESKKTMDYTGNDQ
jgi:hypothetical protein